MYSMPERISGNPIVIVGGGIAGGNAAVTLREEGFRGRVAIVSREPGIPFGRPPLSKTYLRSEENLDGWYVRPAGWYEEHHVDRLGESSVVGIDAAAQSAPGLGQELRYQKVLIAREDGTGG
jgi:NADPH-dependent 2,4-dienoyl-CoA reductase/sulfur reductase-like enzyme